MLAELAWAHEAPDKKTARVTARRP